jgi:hypothetical protein
MEIKMSQNTSNSARQASLARRKAMSTVGKAALKNVSTNTVAAATSRTASSAVNTVAPQNAQGGSARKAALARRIAMSKGGKKSVANTDRTRNAPANTSAAVIGQKSNDTNSKDCGCGCKKDSASAPAATVSSSNEMTMAAPTQIYQGLVKKVKINSARAAALSRRKAMSTKGKTALKGGGTSAASAARASNPDLSSRELAKILRAERSSKGKTSKKETKTKPTGPRRRAEKVQDAPPKVGESETAHGQFVTGTMVGRSEQVTGDEPSTCRDVTGTEYLGADVFRNFCQSDPVKTPRKVSVSSTTHGNSVSGNKIGRGQNVTGDEPGTCQHVTGNEYIGASQTERFCSTKTEAGPLKITSAETRKGKSLTGNNVGRSGKVTGDELGADRDLTGTQYTQAGSGNAPKKVGVSATLRGGVVSGTMTGRSENVTGDEPGSCRNVTGDDYIGEEQFKSFCGSTPQPKDRKVGMSSTLDGKTVSGTMTGRSEIVTGDESGTCKAVTGTPYSGAEQLSTYCNATDVSLAAARQRSLRATPGAALTGQQPGVAGKMTGANKGVCESVSGTPYVGSDQFADACPATAAQPNSPDFPQALGTAPWKQFSVNSPAGESTAAVIQGGVTGSASGSRHVTGPFGMAAGKLTGTDDARFGKTEQHVVASPVPATAEMVEGRVKSRISGEGMSSGIKISGDDWDRGEHVTGTEGMSAARRNPTIRSTSPVVMPAAAPPKRNDEIVVPVSKVTGGSGNTEQGAFVTYSGGARG